MAKVYLGELAVRRLVQPKNSLRRSALSKEPTQVLLGPGAVRRLPIHKNLF